MGVTHGQVAIAAGMAAAPFVSLCIIPFAFGHVHRRPTEAASRLVSDPEPEIPDPVADATTQVPVEEYPPEISRCVTAPALPHRSC